MSKNIAIPYKEAELWNSFRAGNEASFSRIYEGFADDLYSYGCRINSDKELVKDCIQDLFVKLWNTSDRLGPTTSIKYYLFRSLRRSLAHEVKQGKVFVKEEGYADAVETSCEENWIKAETDSNVNRALEAALQELSVRQREAVYLKYYQSMDFDEIASLMDITPRAVYKLLYRAIDILKKSYFSTNEAMVPSLYVSYPRLQLYTVLLFLPVLFPFGALPI